METRSDNLRKVLVPSKTKKPKKEAGLTKKVTTASLDRQVASVSRKKELPQLTPLHRLQRFKAIRDKNLKSRGSKTSLENRIKNMEEVATATTTTIEIKEKTTIKETIAEVEVSNTNGIEKFEESVKELKNGSGVENGLKESSGSSSRKEEKMTSRLKEEDEGQTVEIVNVSEKVEVESKISQDPDPIQDSNIESNMEADEANKIYSESLPESDAVSSISSQQAVSNSTPSPTDDEEEVEIIDSKPKYELTKERSESDIIKEDNKEVAARNSFHFQEAPEASNRVLSNTSVASSYKSSYSNLSRIYGRRPVRYLISSRKRKFEEELVKNYDNKRTNSPSQPSPRWRFVPSNVNFWTPRTTPFAFSASTPMKSLNDSMTVNVDEDTIHNNLDDSELFSDADELAPQPAKKSRWGCAIM